MAEYTINKGVGKQVEFKGLRAQYLFIFAGGLLGLFILFVALYLTGVPTMACIFITLPLGTVLVWLTFRLNSRYGAYGLMKHFAARHHPRRIVHRKHLRRLMRHTQTSITATCTRS